MNDDRNERVRRRAYEIWEERGRPEGSHAEHWEQAERELSNDRNDDPVEGSRETVERELSRQEEGTAEDNGKDPVPPMRRGEAPPESDTSRSRAANRDIEGPRKSGASPRPTGGPLID